MSAMTKTSIALAVILGSQPVIAHGQAASNCSISGIEFVQTTATSKTLCDGLNKRLDMALADSKAHDKRDLTLVIQKRGSIQATLTTHPQTGAEKTVVLGLDVMDRPIMQKDLNELVDAVARAMARY
ncbi:hypothetical protein [Altererythrobacter lutimaris]|uniref:Uncharacterized protein n=1 Tax=Altererythrobacter lutimaris TaxID=2743979 RepID=A0A850HA62_9SPHN|nr:hypothetical protein [Altererythrobacter lutimaris]NVE96057.1 hypothetical protein [Altererythrobacter lutimaris]